MNECIFCKIAEGSIPSTKVYEDGRVLAFLDIQPQAPVHVIVIPKTHYASLDACEDAALLGHIAAVCARVARDKGLDASGYRVATNVGKDGAQSVQHLHFHVLGGRALDGRLG